ncbi:hypothetical protein, partial [Mesorhizobium sp. M0227]|uniref:hypothetical protein n=1 Tax=Mesorhizobium sp. M0227 TaxID=2956922 RepID=UPI00333BAD3F
MEIDEAREVRTTCPYCGVGCGVLAKAAAGGHVYGPGPPAPPAKLRPRSSKGSAHAAANHRDGR